MPQRVDSGLSGRVAARRVVSGRSIAEIIASDERATLAAAVSDVSSCRSSTPGFTVG